MNIDNQPLNKFVKNRKLKKSDFISAMKSSDITDKSIENIFKKFKTLPSSWHKEIEKSFLSDKMKKNYHAMIDKKFEQIMDNNSHHNLF